MARKTSSMYNDDLTTDEDIIKNLGKYIEPLVRQWLLIAVCALGSGILALAFSKYISHSSPSYQAVALVASAQTLSSVDFGSAITTLSDVELAQRVYGSTLYDRATRLQSFISQVQNGAIAEKVLEEVAPVLNVDGELITITATDLKDMVSAELIPKTDTISISVTYSDPVIAAEIANAWGMAYVQWINELYSSSGTSSMATEAEVTQAKTEYAKAEAAFDDFIARDKTAEYTRQVEEISTIITILREARSAVGEQQVQDHLTKLNQAYTDSRQAGQFLGNAVSMRAAVSAGGETAAISNALALTMLKTQIYAAYAGTNSLQVQNLPEALGSTISTITAAGMVADLDALIATLETRLVDLNKLIDNLSSDVQKEGYLMNFSNASTPIEKKILEYEQKVRDLKSQVAAQSSKRDELTQARDLAWASYSALATKAIEKSVAAQDNQLVFASSATTGKKSSGISVVPASGVGLLLGILVAYAYEFWQIYKGHQPEMISKIILNKAMKLVHKRSIQSRNP